MVTNMELEDRVSQAIKTIAVEKDNGYLFIDNNRNVVRESQFVDLLLTMVAGNLPYS